MLGVALRLPAAACVAAAMLALTGCSGSAVPADLEAGGASISWELIDPDPTSDAGPATVIAWGDGYLGLGSGRSWTTKDLRTWTSSPLPGDLLDAKLVAIGDRLVGAGTVNDGRLAAVWTSGDGVTWTDSHDADLAPASGFQATNISGLAAGPGGIVAIGGEWGENGQRPAAWWSTDGVEWTRSTEPLVGSGARDIAVVGDGFVIVGADDAVASEWIRAAFWLSADGRSWTTVADDGVRGGKEPQGVVAFGAGLVSVGYRFVTDGRLGALAPMAWTSSDGRSWSAVVPSDGMSPWPYPGASPVSDEGAIWGSMMWDVAAFPSVLLAVGGSVGLDPDSPLPDGTHQMMSTRAVWRSSDGSAWNLLDPGLPGSGLEPATGLGPSLGLHSVVNVNGRPVIIGTAADGTWELWLGSFTGGG